MGIAGGNPHPKGHKGKNCREGNFGEEGAVIFRKQGVPILLLMCEYCCGGNPTVKEMIMVVGVLKEMTKK